MENPLEGCKLIKNVVDQVEEIVAENPHSSTRMSDQTNVSHTNVRRILSRRLHMHPHKMFVVQEILPRDHNSRMQYCNFFQQKINNEDVLDLSFFTDKSWFHLSGYVNKQNYRTWSAVNLPNLLEFPLYPVKIGIRLAVSSRRIIEPIFLHDTISGQCCREK
jgi:hypothetical protein